MYKFLIRFIPILAFSFLSIQCDSNPFGSDKVSGGATEISGRVVLQDGDSSDGVFVWLDGFSNGVYTESNGEFTMPIEPVLSGTSGVFTLYAFVENYYLDSAKVAIRNGEFVYDDEDIGKNGALIAELKPEKFLRISTQVSPLDVIVEPNVRVRVSIATTLQAITDTATVAIPFSIPGNIGALFMQNLDTGEYYLYKCLPVQTTTKISVGNVEQQISTTFEFINLNLPKGNYQFSPYLRIYHQKLPAGLIESIGLNAEAFGPNFKKFPVKRTDAFFDVK